MVLKWSELFIKLMAFLYSGMAGDILQHFVVFSKIAGL